MKLTEKHLTAIFCAIFVLVVIVGYIFSVSSPKNIPAPQEAGHVPVPIAPLSPEDAAYVKSMESEKLTPLSPEDKALIQQVSATPLRPLSSGEEAYIKKMGGN